MTTAPTDSRLNASRLTDDDLAAQRLVAQRAVRSVLGVTTDEEDLVQEVLMRLVVRARQPGEIDPAAWTWRVARNLAIDFLRVRRATPTDPGLLDREVGGGLDDHVIALELAEAVSDGLSRLPERQRHALVAQAGLDGGRGTYALVASQLGVTNKAAESILARARHALRHELDRIGVGDAQWGAVAVLLRALLRGARRAGRAISPSSLGARAATIAMVVVAGSGVVALAPWQGDAPRTPPAQPSSASTTRRPGAALRTGARPSAQRGTKTALPALTSSSVPTLVLLPPAAPPLAVPRLPSPPIGAPLSLPAVPPPPQAPIGAITIPPLSVAPAPATATSLAPVVTTPQLRP